MSQNKIIIKNSNYARNISSSRSSEPIKKFKTKFEVAKRTITKLKPSESTLMKENQSFYKYQYSLQDKADDTNINSEHALRIRDKILNHLIILVM